MMLNMIIMIKVMIKSDNTDDNNDDIVIVKIVNMPTVMTIIF